MYNQSCSSLCGKIAAEDQKIQNKLYYILYIWTVQHLDENFPDHKNKEAGNENNLIPQLPKKVQSKSAHWSALNSTVVTYSYWALR